MTHQLGFGAVLKASLRSAEGTFPPGIGKILKMPLETIRRRLKQSIINRLNTLKRPLSLTLSLGEGRKCAFTLAETLITLGIIGIVAALVIPNAVSNYRKHIVETKLKQTYSILANAVSAAETEIGMPFGKWYMTTYHPDLVAPGIFKENSNALYQDFIKPYLNTKNIKENKTLGYIEHSNAVTVFGTHFTLPNGCTVFIYNYQIYVLTDPLSFNSKKKVKIQNGKNLFYFGPAIGVCDRLCSGYFEIPHTFAPMVDCSMPSWANTRQVCRSSYTDKQMKENCTKNDPLYARFCTQLLIENDFKFPKDYPIKF